MVVNVRLHEYFQDFTHGQKIVEANGGNVFEIIDDLERKYPGIKEHILDKKGRLQGWVEMFVNADVVYPESASMPVRDGDELELLLIVAGG
jgi:sulfur-carrier protein